MNKTTPIVSILLICSANLFAQHNELKKQPKNELSVFYTSSYYFNKKYLEFEGPNNPLKPHNTLGWEAGLSYRRYVYRGAFAEASLAYGQQSHKMDVLYDLTGFDPEAKQNLKGQVLNLGTIESTTPYYRVNLSIGYRYALNKKLSITGKIGTNATALMNGILFAGGTQNLFVYRTDNGSEARAAQIADPTYFFGQNQFTKRDYPNTWWYKSPGGVLQMTIGARYCVNWRNVSSIDLSLTGTKGRLDGDISLDYLPSFGGNFAYSQYRNRNMSLGITLGINFWKF